MTIEIPYDDKDDRLPSSFHREELREMVTTPGKERMTRYRQKQQEKGLKTVTVYLSPEAQKVLARLMEENPHATMGQIISDVLTRVTPQEVADRN